MLLEENWQDFVVGWIWIWMKLRNRKSVLGFYFWLNRWGCNLSMLERSSPTPAGWKFSPKEETVSSYAKDPKIYVRLGILKFWLHKPKAFQSSSSRASYLFSMTWLPVTSVGNVVISDFSVTFTKQIQSVTISHVDCTSKISLKYVPSAVLLLTSSRSVQSSMDHCFILPPPLPTGFPFSAHSHQVTSCCHSCLYKSKTGCIYGLMGNRSQIKNNDDSQLMS